MSHLHNILFHYARYFPGELKQCPRYTRTECQVTFLSGFSAKNVNTRLRIVRRQASLKHFVVKQKEKCEISICDLPSLVMVRWTVGLKLKPYSAQWVSIFHLNLKSCYSDI